MSIASARTGDNSTDRLPVTVIGLGLMGAALARALNQAGHQTTVWNRSGAKADPLVAAGATRAETMADAVAASPLVITCVLDYAVMDSLLEPVAGELPGRTLVNLTSGTPEHARAAADWAIEHGIDYLDGKILAFPSTIGTSEALLLYSGAHDTFTSHEPTLTTLGGASYLGNDPGLASLYDLGVVGLMYGVITGFVHALALLRADGVDPESFLPYATEALPIFPIADIARQVQTADYDGREAHLNMQATYMEHIISTSETRGIDPTFPTYVKNLMERAILAGHGNDDFGRLIEGVAMPGEVTTS
jgi:3-hydroxyisobutyrate dehydrogenase-like beta-hydroxyacid dehydrogenase